ncbi:MAG: hypothetical protein IBX46_09365 [Desulfuromonadales bacterium]|nr:hypothetical protein [Desulfuromonadales bacterium]
MTRRNVRRKVMIPLTLTFLVLFAAFLYSGYAIREEKIERELAHRYEVAQSTLNEVIARRVEVMTTVGQFLADDQLSLAAMRKGDRGALYRQAAPFYARMAENAGITHLYYHTPDGHNFLRAYRPEVFGDLITRQTLRHAIKTGMPSHGLELGDLGTLTLRVVTPWRDENGLLGFIEIGTEIETLLSALRKIGGFDYVVSVQKEYLDRAKWEEGMHRLHRFSLWETFPNKVVIDSSLDIPEANLAKILNLTGRINNSGSWYEINSGDGRRFAIRKLALIEAGNRLIGDYFLLYDTTNETKVFYLFIVRVIGIGLFLSGALFIFAWRILGRTDRELTTTTQQLVDEKNAIETINLSLATEIELRRQVEVDLQLLNEQLEERVHERTAKLEVANHEIEKNRNELASAYADLQAKQATILHQDKMACIGQLAAGVAHDINNPVGFVSHNLDLFARYFDQLAHFIALQEELIKSRGDSDLMSAWEKGQRDFKVQKVFADLAEMIEECRDGTGRITRIVQSLRSFSRQEHLQLQLTDLHHCLESTLTILRPELRDKVTVLRDYGELPQIYCYTDQINQVLMNLLLNAAQAITDTGEIHVRSWTENEQIYLSIADSGCGIPAEKLERIFTPFYTTKPIGVGTGLGLSIAYDIIVRHQGEIRVESAPGVGTTFTIRLPFDIRSQPRAPKGEAKGDTVINQRTPGADLDD